MGIAFRYVSRELLAIFVVTAVVLLVIALGGRFMGYLQDAALGKHSADALLKIMALRVPEFLQLTLPFSFYIALVLTAARLYADQEMTVLVTSGSSPAQVMVWITVSALVVAIVVAYLSTQATPRANGVLERYLLEESAEREFETMTPGMFHTINDGARVTYSEGDVARQARAVAGLHRDGTGRATTSRSGRSGVRNTSTRSPAAASCGSTPDDATKA